MAAVVSSGEKSESDDFPCQEKPFSVNADWADLAVERAGGG